MAAAASLCKTFTEKMAEGYNPSAVEGGWYPFWENSGYFKPKSDREPVPESTERFVIVLPPPNVTGYLHLGHALTGAVQDAVVRYHRMRGCNTLYLPGTDHAGIATQVVVEKRLAKATGKTRHDLGREPFLEKVWEFKHEHSGAIQKQLRLIGSSLDWSREAFTLDPKCNVAVTEAFVRMYDDGIISRDTRLVNWCCTLQSAISDLEVDNEDILPMSQITVPGFKGKVEVGRLTQVAYKVVGMDAELVVATTRPETILGDTAIAVHPDDERYKKFHGMRVQCPFRDETIPIVCDPILVDPAFGTGVVKVTPAHDQNDFECGNRHRLPRLNILDLNGFISLPGPFQGMHRFEARAKIVTALEQKGLFRGQEPNAMRIGRCSRTNDIIEPLLMPQWFVDCTQMAADSVKAVETGALKIIPEDHISTWNHYLKNIKPWCVSRQLWWGHRIPAYVAKVNGTPAAGGNAEDSWIVARNLDEAKSRAIAKFSIADPSTLTLEQDPDVLDTWFSSGLWPFSTLGWPEAGHPDMSKFFPGSLLETGHDILFFWVARMVMMSLYLTKQLPFTEVYLHAMVRDKDGRKMSKSLGNVIDPVDVIRGCTLEHLNQTIINGNLDPKELEKAIKYQKETYPTGIPECGSDALRFGLLAYTQSGRNVNMDVERIVAYRQFCNKLWNVVRYILYYALDDTFDATQTLAGIPRDQLPLECLWILSRLDVAVQEANEGLSRGTYDFAKATTAAYRFWLYELCDVFLEFSKVSIQQRPKGDALRNVVQITLLHVVEVALRMLHPMMPFVTEELWHRLPNYSTFGLETIMIAAYPQPAGWKNAEVESRMASVLDVIHNLRSVKGQYQLTPKQRPDCWVVGRNPEVRALTASQAHLIKFLAAVGEVVVIENDAQAPDGCGFNNVNTELGTFVMLRGMIDVAKEIAKIDKQAALLQKQLDGLEAKKKVPGYEAKVPADVRKANDEKAAAVSIELAQLADAKQRMARFS